MRGHMRLSFRTQNNNPSRHSGAMRSIEPGIHNPRPWLWIPGLRQAAHPGMTPTSIFSSRPQTRHCERSEAIHLHCGCAMDCFASLAMTVNSRVRLFENQIQGRRPAQAKRDAGPITTRCRLRGSHRTASLKTSDTTYESPRLRGRHRFQFFPAVATPVIASAAKQSIFLADVPWIASLRSQ